MAGLATSARTSGLTEHDLGEFLHANDRLLEEREEPDLQIISQIPFISNSSIDWLEIRPSTHGNGLFATRDIPKNRCITLYPTHQIAYKVLDTDPEWQVISPQGEPNYYSDYSLTINPRVKIAGIPSMYNNLLFVGHMINDPCPNVSIRKLKDWLSRYDRLKPNTEFRIIKDLWTGIFSTRDIKAGEELFVCYGPKYWLRRQQPQRPSS